MRFSDIRGRTVAVWGFGRETQSFLRHAEARLPGTRFAFGVDDSSSSVPSPAGRHEPLRADLRLVSPDELVRQLSAGDVLVRSPGVSVYRPEIQALKRSGVTVVTPTGLWLAERAGRRVIGVTGTKGKSTTASLVWHLGTAAGAALQLAGNIGRPALDLLDSPPEQWAVVELSSYQIVDLTVGPEVAVLTTLFKEHTDWHRGEAVYRKDKLRLFTLPGVKTCVLPPPGSNFGSVGEECRRTVRFDVPGGWHVTPDGVRGPSGAFVAAERLPLRGHHNARNLCAALATLDAAGFPRPRLPASLEDVASLPHRLQTVHVADGIEWVDDSISTTPESSIAALRAFSERPVVLIAGGQDRDQDYAELARLAAEARVVIAGLPITGARLVAAARRAGLADADAVDVPDMTAAVDFARRRAQPGSVVLLSPAAPSYNSYLNFEERGCHFAALAATASEASSGDVRSRA